MKLALFVSAVVFIFSVELLPSAHAEETREEEKVRVKAICSEYEAANMPADEASGPKKTNASNRLPPVYPSNAPFLPFVCVFVQFDITEDGRTTNAEVVFRAPQDAPEAFDRAALKSVKRWRYETERFSETTPPSDVITKITYESR